MCQAAVTTYKFDRVYLGDTYLTTVGVLRVDKALMFLEESFAYRI